MFNPKIEIVNYYDELIHQVDIDIEEALKQCNENQVLADLECFKFEPQTISYNLDRFLNFFESSQTMKLYVENYYEKNYYVKNYQRVNTVDFWPESTKVVDYLNQVRMRTIEELKKAQEETLEYYKLNSDRFTTFKEMSEELKSQLFAEKFYFQIRSSTKNCKPCIFNVFTFVTDFYMSQSDIDILK